MDGIRAFRKEKSLTIRQLADLSGYSAAEISRWETGKRPIRASDLERLAQALDIEPSTILQYGKDVGKSRHIMVQGAACANIWLDEVFWPKESRYAVQIPAISDVDKQAQVFAIEVSDQHVNQRYPEGTVLILLKYDTEKPHPLIKGKRYLIQRIDDQGKFELTVMRLDVNGDDQAWLVSETLDPSLQRSIRYSPSNPALKILGRVLRAIVPE